MSVGPIEPISRGQFFLITTTSVVVGGVYIWPQTVLTDAGLDAPWAVLLSISVALGITWLQTLWPPKTTGMTELGRMQAVWGWGRWPVFLATAALYHVFRRWPAAVRGISGDRGRGTSRRVKGPAADRGVVDGRRVPRAQPGGPQGPVERSGAGLPAGRGQWPPRGERAPPCRAASPPVPWALALRSRGIGRHRRHGPHAMTTERSRCAAVVRHARPWPAPHGISSGHSMTNTTLNVRKGVIGQGR